MVGRGVYVCGAIIKKKKSGACEANNFPQACLWRFCAAEWRTLVYLVSSNCEMKFEEEIVSLTLLHNKLKNKWEHKFCIDILLISSLETWHILRCMYLSPHHCTLQA